MRKQLRSLRQIFACAWAGLRRGILTQRNLRIHLALSCWATWLGTCLELTQAQLAVLFLTCGVVVIAELLNTAVEALTDHLIPNRSVTAKTAKDAAAGAVLAGAAFAVCVGVVLLWRPDKLLALGRAILGEPVQLGLLALAAGASLWFIFGIGSKRRIHD